MGTIDFTNFSKSNSGGLNLIDNQGQTATTNISTSDNTMRQLFKNNDIALYYTTQSRSSDGNTINGMFYVSNNIDKRLNNIKLNFGVLNYLTLKVVSTNGTNLEPNQSLGYKKVNRNKFNIQEVTITNSDPSKPVRLQIKYGYTMDSKEVHYIYLILDI